jgi:hypothetical protein
MVRIALRRLRARALRLLRALLLGTALVLAASTVLAEPAGLPVVIHTGGSTLDGNAIRRAVERELGVALSIDSSAEHRLEITLTGRRANVTYFGRGREPVTRAVDLPRDDERALATIAFLAGNLARDEAAVLLSELSPTREGRERDEPAEVSPPSPPPVSAPPAAAQTEPKRVAAPRPPTRPAAKLIEPNPFAANASLYYPVTILEQTERRRLNFELGLLYSRAGAVRGAAMTLGYLRVDGAVDGYSYALFWNRAGPVTGVQMANFVNEGYGTLKGVSYADLVNVRDGRILGVQVSGIYARGGQTDGLQAAGIFGHASGVDGVQASGIASLAGDVSGVQAATMVSVAKNVDGVQAAGIVNVAGRVRGLQLGVVNVAEEIHGGAIGLVSIAKNGRLQPTAWLPGPSAGPLVGVKSVTDLTYTQLGVGYDPVQERFRQDLSVGLHLALGQRFYAETGLGFAETYRAGRGERVYSNRSLVRGELRYEGRVGFEPVRGITPFIGGGLTQRMQGGGAPFRGEYCFGLSVL